MQKILAREAKQGTDQKSRIFLNFKIKWTGQRNGARSKRTSAEYNLGKQRETTTKETKVW